jgi:hypothetical protein
VLIDNKNLVALVAVFLSMIFRYEQSVNCNYVQMVFNLKFTRTRLTLFIQVYIFVYLMEQSEDLVRQARATASLDQNENPKSVKPVMYAVTMLQTKETLVNYGRSKSHYS